MNLSKVMTGNVHQAVKSEQALRAGQILQGKILKIYPDNKAQILLNGKQMVAQLKASIQVEGKYLFQVESAGDMIHLKVIGEENAKKENANLALLLSRFGLKASGKHTALLQRLVQEGIPFMGLQIKAAAELMGQGRTSAMDRQVLVEMIAQKLPITENVFQALSASKNNQLSGLMEEVRAAVAGKAEVSPIAERLQRILDQMLANSRPGQGEVPIPNRISSEKFAAFDNLLQRFHLMGPNATVSAAREENTSASQRLPDSVPAQSLVALTQNKDSLIRAAQEALLLGRGGNAVALTSSPTVLQQEYTSVKAHVEQKLLPFLSLPHRNNFVSLLAEGADSLTRIYQVMETLADENAYRQLDNIVKMNQLSVKPKDTFMQHLTHFLRFAGLNHEQRIATGDVEMDPETLKSILVKMVQQPGEGDNPKAQQLLHLINGMQLNSVNEAGGLLQATLLLPGEKLGLLEDLKLEFESRRTEDGKIDPDHCRVLFYLDLNKLKETVIDMHVQKRSVSLVVYNDFPGLGLTLKKLQPVLKQGLQMQEYTLSSLSQKPLSDKSKVTAPQVLKSKTVKQDSGGVDYRI